MSAEQEVEIRVSEVLLHLRENGAFRRALDEVVQKKAAGQEVATVKVVTDLVPSEELGEEELEAVAGGMEMMAQLEPRNVISYRYPIAELPPQRIPGLPGSFADTSW
jgi:hypothetical protein